MTALGLVRPSPRSLPLTGLGCLGKLRSADGSTLTTGAGDVGRDSRSAVDGVRRRDRHDRHHRTRPVATRHRGALITTIGAQAALADFCLFQSVIFVVLFYPYGLRRSRVAWSVPIEAPDRGRVADEVEGTGQSTGLTGRSRVVLGGEILEKATRNWACIPSVKMPSSSISAGRRCSPRSAVGRGGDVPPRDCGRHARAGSAARSTTARGWRHVAANNASVSYTHCVPPPRSTRCSSREQRRHSRSSASHSSASSLTARNCRSYIVFASGDVQDVRGEGWAARPGWISRGQSRNGSCGCSDRPWLGSINIKPSHCSIFGQRRWTSERRTPNIFRVVDKGAFGPV